MLGPRLNTVFASRWKALWWSAGILLTAYCSVPQAPDDTPATPAPARPAQTQHPANQHPANPWALK